MSTFLTCAVEDARLEGGWRLLGAPSSSTSSCLNLTFFPGPLSGSGSGGVLTLDGLCSTEVEQRFKAENACVWFGDVKRMPSLAELLTSHAAFFIGAQVGCQWVKRPPAITRPDSCDLKSTNPGCSSLSLGGMKVGRG